MATARLFTRNLFCIFLAGILFQGIGWGKTTIRFRNSVTGLRIPGAVIERGSGSNNRSVTDGSAVTFATGQNRVKVLADGFAPAEVSLEVSSLSDQLLTFYLDPVDAAHKAGLDEGHVRSVIHPDEMLITGVITNADDGEALEGAYVTIGGKALVSSAAGYFYGYLPLDAPPVVTISCKGYRTVSYANLPSWPGGDAILQVRMERGEGIDMRTIPGPGSHGTAEHGDVPQPVTSFGDEREVSSGIVVPSMIRLGRTCSTTVCSSVDIYSLETYSKHVLPAEWAPCWGSLTGGMNSLLAGAVAVRTVGVWYAYHPLSTRYDICDNTTCQVFNPTLTTTNTNKAIDSTQGILLQTGSGAVGLVQYAAENNNSGCGDGHTGTGTASSPCIADPVCTGQPKNGHGKGVCQFGSARWATGTTILPGSICAAGSPHIYGSQDWRWILNHYYPAYTIEQGTTASMNAMFVTTHAPPGAFLSAVATVHLNGGPIAAIFDIVIHNDATDSVITDSLHASKFQINSDTIISRDFKLPANAPSGSYNAVFSLRFDAGGNGVLRPDDFTIAIDTVSAALSIIPEGVKEWDVPNTFGLLQNYPNPFNNSTVIRYAVGKRSVVRLEIFDLFGRLVSILVNGVRDRGIYDARWDAAEASGVYYVRLTAEGQTRVRPVILNR